MRRSKANRKVKEEIFVWMQSNLEPIMDLFNIKQKDFVALLGTSRQVFYNVLHRREAMNGRWVLSIFTVLDYICMEKRETLEYEIVLHLMRPMAHYATHIDEIYED